MIIKAFIVLSIFFLSLYVVMIIAYTIGWINTKTYFHSSYQAPKTFVSVIIPTRNEEKNIKRCLQALLNQHYPRELFEIIISDDNSSDATASIIKRCIQAYSFPTIHFIHLEEMANNTSPKKRALTAGIKASRGKLILTTDADCVMGKDWLSTIVSYYETFSPKMIISPVHLYPHKHCFGQLQALEFISLIGSAGASLHYGLPLMGSGANMAFEKEAFMAVKGYQGNEQLASGDDVFLLLKFHKYFGNGKCIQFLKSPKAIVFTPPQNSLKAFIEQRKRWASKSHSYKSVYVKSISLLVYIVNLSLTINLAISIFYNSFAFPFLIFFGIKCIVDWFFLYAVATFFGRKKLLLWLIPEQLLYIFYVGFIGFISALPGISYSWKGRVLKSLLL